MNVIFAKRLWYVMLEQFLMKYVWSGTGLATVAITVILGKKLKNSSSDGGVSERTQYFTTAKNMLMSGGDAVERLMTSYKVRNILVWVCFIFVNFLFSFFL